MAHFRLKDVAERERWSARRISRASGLSYTAVQGVWSNRAKRVNLDTLQRLAVTIGVSVKDLIDDGDDAKGKQGLWNHTGALPCSTIQNKEKS